MCEGKMCISLSSAKQQRPSPNSEHFEERELRRLYFRISFWYRTLFFISSTGAGV